MARSRKPTGEIAGNKLFLLSQKRILLQEPVIFNYKEGKTSGGEPIPVPDDAPKPEKASKWQHFFSGDPLAQTSGHVSFDARCPSFLHSLPFGKHRPPVGPFAGI